MVETKEDLDQRLEVEIGKHLQRYVDYFDSLGMRTAGNDLLEYRVGENRIIDRRLLAAYLSLRAERRAEEDNRRAARDNKILQIGIGLLAAISASGTVVQALVAAHVIV
jgi:hypothetical protein